MGKKSRRNSEHDAKGSEENGEIDIAPKCPHLAKALSISRLRKAFASGELGDLRSCKQCERDEHDGREKEVEEIKDEKLDDDSNNSNSKCHDHNHDHDHDDHDDSNNSSSQKDHGWVARSFSAATGSPTTPAATTTTTATATKTTTTTPSPDISSSPVISPSPDMSSIPVISPSPDTSSIPVISPLSPVISASPTPPDNSAAALRTDPVIDDEDVANAIWVCLQCANRGCSRYTEHQHAVKHQNASYSDSHDVAVNCVTWQVWCYKCDDYLHPHQTEQLDQAIKGLQSTKNRGKDATKSSKNKLKSFRHVPTIKTEGTKDKALALVPVDTDSTLIEVDSLLALHELRVRIVPTPVDGLQRPKGLTNLGNTCFFNSVMQNLAQTHLLVDACTAAAQDGVKWTVRPMGKANDIRDMKTLELKLDEAGPLTVALSEFFREFHHGSKAVFSPGALFSRICDKSPQFRSFRQQDSHELLRHLFEGVFNEESRRMKRTILNNFGLKTNTNPDTVKPHLRSMINAYKKQTHHTFLETVFGGLLINTILCLECRKSSQNFEPFVDLSLPIAAARPPKLTPPAGRLPDPDMDDIESRYSGVHKEGLSKHQIKKAKKSRKKKLRQQRDVAANATAEATENSVSPLREKSLVREDSPITSVKLETDELSADTSARESNGSTSSCLKLGEQQSPSPKATDHSKNVTNNRDEKEKEDLGAVRSTPRESQDCSSGIVSRIPSSAIDSDGEVITSLSTANNSGPIASGLGLVNGSELDTHHDDDNSPDEDDDDTNSSNSYSAGPEDRPSDKFVRSSDNDSILAKVGDLDLTQRRQTEELQDASDNAVDVVCPDGEEDELIREHIDVWKQQSLSPLGDRGALYQRQRPGPSDSSDYSVASCLAAFTEVELLTGKNQFGCDHCTEERGAPGKDGKKQRVLSDAQMQLLVLIPPAVLTLQLKRFMQDGMRLKKNGVQVSYPKILDLAPYCSKACINLPSVKHNQTQILYSLYGVVEHSGSLHGGHYTAYVNVRPKTREGAQFLQPFPLKMGLDDLIREMHRRCERGLKIDQGSQSPARREPGSSGSAASVPESSPSPSTNEQNGAAELSTTTLSFPQLNGSIEVTERCDVDEPTSVPYEDAAERTSNEVWIEGGRWFYISDSMVREASETSALNAQAYILFYERLT